MFFLWFLCRCSKLSILFGGELSLTAEAAAAAPDDLLSLRLVADDMAESGCV